MTKEEWHAKYKETFISEGFPEELAEEALQAGIDSYDYDDDPVDSALDDLSYYDADES